MYESENRCVHNNIFGQCETCFGKYTPSDLNSNNSLNSKQDISAQEHILNKLCQHGLEYCDQCWENERRRINKISKAQPTTHSWFDLYLDLKFKLEERIFGLEERVKELEIKNNRLL